MKSSMSRWRVQKPVIEDPDSSGLKVVAAGLWRCATSSLQIAFEEIIEPPSKPCMHGSVIFTHTSQLKRSVSILRERDTLRRQKLLRQFFTGYNASTDFPGMAFVDDLIQLYPNMRIVLNKRSNAEEWEKSVSTSLKPFSTWWYAVIMFPTRQGYWHWRMYCEYKNLAQSRFGKHIDIWTAEYYELHNAWVRHLAELNGTEILEWEPSMEWKLLAEFLNVEIPMQPLPRTNEQDEIKQLMIVMLCKGIAAWFVVIALASVVLFSSHHLIYRIPK